MRKGESRESKKGKLGRKDQPGTEKKANQCPGDVEGEGNAFRDPGPWGSRKGSALSCWVTPTISMGISSTPMSGYTAPPNPVPPPQLPPVGEVKKQSQPSVFLLGHLFVLCPALFLFLVQFVLPFGLLAENTQLSLISMNISFPSPKATHLLKASLYTLRHIHLAKQSLFLVLFLVFSLFFLISLPKLETTSSSNRLILYIFVLIIHSCDSNFWC